MKLNAIGVFARDMKKSVAFYELLGFKFVHGQDETQHVETARNEDKVTLMIDSYDLIKKLLGEEPNPGNLSKFAVQFDSAAEVDEVAAKIKAAGFKVENEPWDAFWGQRYCVVSDPEGFLIDLYAQL